MGREATITQDQVFSIADSIKGAGGKPTLRSIRERLGAGSMATINKHLQQWRSGQDRQAPVGQTLPPGLQRALLEFMASELAAARAPLEADLADQQQVVADLAAENERQAASIDIQSSELEALAAAKSAAEGKAAQLSADLQIAREETARERHFAEQARTELAKAMLRLEAMPRLEADLAAVRDELGKERNARIAAERESAVLAAQKADLVERLGEVRQKAEKAS